MVTLNSYHINLLHYLTKNVYKPKYIIIFGESIQCHSIKRKD